MGKRGEGACEECLLAKRCFSWTKRAVVMKEANIRYERPSKSGSISSEGHKDWNMVNIDWILDMLSKNC